MLNNGFYAVISGSESSDIVSSSEGETFNVSTEIEEITDSSEDSINSSEKSNVSSPSDTEGILKLSDKILSEWPSDDLLQLIERMESTLIENDTTKFTKRVKKINWDDIAFGDHSGDDCKSVWLTIQGQLRQKKSLTEILTDAEELISKIPRTLYKQLQPCHPELPKRPLSAYMIFCSEKREEVYRENPGIKITDGIKLIGTMFNNLSEDERKIYIKREEELKTIYEEQLQQFYTKYPNEVKRDTPSPTNKLQTPFQIYYESQIKSDPSSSESENVLRKLYREKWENLNTDEKIVFIHLALENERKFNKELEDFVEDHKYKSVLSKEERLLSEAHAGKPKKPPHSAYSLFTQIELKKDEMKELDNKERMKLAGSRWNQCSQETKAKYLSEVSKLKEQYKLDYDNYLKSLPEEQREQELKRKSKKRKRTSKDKRIKKKRKIESPEQSDLIEPERPPTAYKLFAQTHCDKDISSEEAWINLNEVEKFEYEMIEFQLFAKYRDEYDAYIRASMPKHSSRTEEDAETSTSSSSSTESASDSVNSENENEDSSSEDSSSNSSNSDESESDEEDSSEDSDFFHF